MEGESRRRGKERKKEIKKKEEKRSRGQEKVKTRQENKKNSAETGMKRGGEERRGKEEKNDDRNEKPGRGKAWPDPGKGWRSQSPRDLAGGSILGACGGWYYYRTVTYLTLSDPSAAAIPTALTR